MELAAATADFESQPGVFPTATKSQPKPSGPVGEPSQADAPSNERTGTARSWSRPRRGNKNPASFADYAVIKPVRGRPSKKRVAEVQPAQELLRQQEEEHDDLSVQKQHVALAIPGLPALPDLGGPIREFMLGDGPKLTETDPLGWLEYGFLAKGKATEAKIGQITSSLRSILKEAELRKIVVGHLGRNSLCTTLLSEDVSSYQTATLMGWSLNDQMQRSYASKTSVAAVPALETAAGSAPGEPYNVPRSTVDPVQHCPNAYKLFVADWMVRLREQVAGCVAQNGVEYEGARDYLLAREHMIKVLLQNFPFYVLEYGVYCAIFRLQAFWAIEGFENGGWDAAVGNHPLLDELHSLTTQVLVAHGESSLAELLTLQKTMMDGNAFPVPCPLLASELPYASEDTQLCGEAFVGAVKASYAEAIDVLLKTPSRASQYHSEQAAGNISEQMQLVGELREMVIRSRGK
ncbi:hypothetical protein KSW81_005882 [Nannochloris sp. 'desiccata']|nr:hypothetical protein KSW81_005882 [Chlorella desiccata (nom. nud.)]